MANGALHYVNPQAPLRRSLGRGAATVFAVVVLGGALTWVARSFSHRGSKGTARLPFEIGKVSDIHGVARVIESSGQPGGMGRYIAVGDSVASGDLVTTGEASTLKILFKQGSELEISPASAVELELRGNKTPLPSPIVARTLLGTARVLKQAPDFTLESMALTPPIVRAPMPEVNRGLASEPALLDEHMPIPFVKPERRPATRKKPRVRRQPRRQVVVPQALPIQVE